MGHMLFSRCHYKGQQLALNWEGWFVGKKPFEQYKWISLNSHNRFSLQSVETLNYILLCFT